MIEKEVQKKIATSARALGMWYYKMPDMPMSPQQDRDENFRFNPVKPCDCMIASQGKVAFIELKATKERRLPFSCIRESQEKHMSALTTEMIPVWLLVYWTPGETLFAFPWFWWTTYRNCAKMKSIELDSGELKRFSVKETKTGVRLSKKGDEWGGKWAWDLRPLLGIQGDV